MDKLEQNELETRAAQLDTAAGTAADFSFKSLLERFYLKNLMLKAEEHHSGELNCMLD